MNKESTPFVCSLTRWERILGLIYLPLHIFALPILLGLFASVSLRPLSQMQMTTIYYLIGLAYLLLCMRRCLLRDWSRLWDVKLQALLALITGYLISVVLSYGVSILMLLLGDGANPNDAAITEMTAGNARGMFPALVLLAPIVEETLFRGVLFGMLRQRSRIAAYVVSTAVFALYHIWQYALVSMDVTLLIYALQYIPASVALAWCYERTGSLWTPVVYHALSNLASLLLLSQL